jgi:predicted SpoU family rRNA methylase
MDPRVIARRFSFCRWNDGRAPDHVALPARRFGALDQALIDDAIVSASAA